MATANLDGLDIGLYRTDNLPANVWSAIQVLFTANYRQANIGYLEHSFTHLRYLALAMEDRVPAGFAMGDCIETRIPGIDEPQIVVLGGMGCIAERYRRRGLFGHLESMATRGSGLLPATRRILSCGRMAHPAGFMPMSRNPTVVPKFGIAITPWQREVGLRVAELYGVELDPETFVVIGRGVPVGYPRIDVQASEDDWRLFRQVNRDRGDSLLGIAWSPDAPAGWNTPA